MINQEKSACRFRKYFDIASHEWNQTSLDEKLKELTILLKDENITTLKLALNMLEECNEQNKEIKLFDLILSMSQIIDHSLKKDSKIKK